MSTENAEQNSTEYEDAWNDTEDAGKEDDQPGAGEAEGQQAENAGKPEQEPEQTEDDGQAQAATEDAGDELEEKEDYEAKYQEAVQRMKSWEGRIAKEARERKEAEERLAEMQAEIERLKAEGPKPDEPETDTEAVSQKTDELLDEFRQQYGDDLPDYVVTLAEQNARKQVEAEAKALKDGLMKEIEPIKTAMQQLEQERMIAMQRERVLSVHSDMDDLVSSGAITQWIDTLPDMYKSTAQAIYEQGDADQIIALLDQYKATTKKPDSNQNRRMRTPAVQSHSSGAPKSEPSKNDYEAGWNM